MRVVELLIWAIVALAVVMQLAHIPLASLLLILGLSTASMMYFALSWFILPHPTCKDQHIRATVLASIGLGYLCIGILFKLQAWPLATFQCLFGIALTSLAFFMALMNSRNRPERRPYLARLAARFAPLTIIALLLIPVDAHTMMRFHHRDKSPKQLELIDRLDSTEEPEARERIWRQIDSLEVEELKRQSQ